MGLCRARGWHRALDEAAAEHAGLALPAVVEHAGLSGGHAVLAAGELDLVAVRGAREPRRLRRARRAHLHEHVHAAGAERGVERALADPVHLAQTDAARGERLARADDDTARG